MLVLHFALPVLVGLEVLEVFVIFRTLRGVRVPFHVLKRPDGRAQLFVADLLCGFLLHSFLAYLDTTIIDFEVPTEGRVLDLSFQRCTHPWVSDYFDVHVTSDVCKKLLHLQDSLFRILRGPGYRDVFVLFDIDPCTKRPLPFLDLLKIGNGLKRHSRRDGN